MMEANPALDHVRKAHPFALRPETFPFLHSVSHLPYFSANY
jgi:hypothetical protein